MFDPAALGTLRIGLDAIEAEARNDRPRSAVRTRPAVRVVLAGALRRAAAMLDRPTVREVAR